MVEVNRRAFLSAAATAAAGVLAEDDKLTDGGYAEVLPPGVPARKTPIVPPWAGGLDSFSSRCVACQLCVAQCPNNVLRPLKERHPGSSLEILQPVMGFERGYCRPECTTCGEVCPAGAIRRITPQEKRKIQVGRAVWNSELCLAAAEGVTCHACERHCPAGAIALAPIDKADKASPKVPRIDDRKCTGCGACEHLCPARPLPAIVVEGLRQHCVMS